MKIIDCLDFKIILLESSNEDPDMILPSYDESQLVYVPMKGYVGEEFSHNRFLTDDPSLSFSNHLMWEGLFDWKEQLDYIIDCCQKFWDTDKQMVIENYDYQEDEPFYDYSK